MWQRAQKRRDVGAALGVKADDGEPALPFTADGRDVATSGAGDDTGDGLGASTAPVDETV